MSVFRNEESHYEMRSPASDEKWHGQSGFNAMGRVVPMFRKILGEEYLKDIGFLRSETRRDIVDKMSESIEKDNIHDALDRVYRSGIDITGCYRLLAVLLYGHEPKDEIV